MQESKTIVAPLPIMQAQMTTNSEMREARNEATIIRKAFKPVMILMKAFGLTSDKINIKNSKDGAYYFQKRKLLKIYGCIIIFILLANAIRLLPAMKSGLAYNLYFKIAYLIWSTRCLFQTMYVIRINWPSKKKSSKLAEFFQDLDFALNVATLENEQKIVKRYTKVMKIIFVLITGIVVMNSIFILIGMFINGFNIHTILENMLYPLSGSTAGKLCYFVLQCCLSVVWMVPIILYLQACKTLVFLLSIHEASIKSFGTKPSLPIHISEIRSMYLKITNLVQTADDIFGPIALSVFFFDIVQFSFTLYISMYSAKTVPEKCLTFFWVFSALMNLIFLSFGASDVEQKGKAVTDLLQRLETSGADAKSNAELSLLLFHLSGDPIVMTIWKLIPLYKSIIVSVFISLITYFTLLLQFK